jgi:outer membrane protein assembly factor BamB
VSARQTWSSRVGQVNFPLETGVAGTSVAVASGDGTVALLDTQTGRDFWRLALNTPLAAGAGNDGKVVAVVSKANEVVALQDGKELWRQKLAPRLSPRLSWPVAGFLCWRQIVRSTPLTGKPGANSGRNNAPMSR